MLLESLREILAYDDTRDNMPGEHLMAAAAGGALALLAMQSRNRVLGTVAAMAAGALLVRAASGRDGVRKLIGAPLPRLSEDDARDVHP